MIFNPLILELCNQRVFLYLLLLKYCFQAGIVYPLNPGFLFRRVIFFHPDAGIII